MSIQNDHDEGIADQVPEKEFLIAQIIQVAAGLSRMFAPLCEVVVHDLRYPQHSTLAIYNNLSGRQVGEPATELGLARIADPGFPQIVANYSGAFHDGRPVKSTSIGIKCSSGRYIAALCLNMDLSVFKGFQATITQFMALDADRKIRETLDPKGGDAIRAMVVDFAASLATTPRALRAEQRRALMLELKVAGITNVKHGMEIAAQCLGVSRATVYTYVK